MKAGHTLSGSIRRPARSKQCVATPRSLTSGVRGKHYQQAIAGTNLVLIQPKLAEVFPDTESVNRALRLLADTAEAAAGPKPRVRRKPNKRLNRTA